MFSGIHRLPGRLLDRKQQRLVEIERRLSVIEGQLNHWITTLEAINHTVADLQQKFADAAADVEMSAALIASVERTVARAVPRADGAG